jgi:hypothetical protein
MMLVPEDCDLFYKLHKALMLYVNRELKLVEPPSGDPTEIVAIPPHDRAIVRNALISHGDLINDFTTENPFELNTGELDIVRSWNHFISGDFYVLRHMTNYTIFMTATKEPRVYGVVGLRDSLRTLIQQPLPFLCKAVLLPFRNQIAYDGLLTGYNVSVGKNLRKELLDTCKAVQLREGIITNLEALPAMPMIGSKKTTRPRKSKPVLLGTWHVTWMASWERDLVSPFADTHITFLRKGLGTFDCGTIQGEIDYRINKRDGSDGVEFSWSGIEVATKTPLSGRGWAKIKGDEIEGEIFVHRGQHSAFRALKKP